MLPSNYQPSVGRVVGWFWIQLSEIKCITKTLAFMTAYSSFNFENRLHFVVQFQYEFGLLHAHPKLSCNLFINELFVFL
jgi:hypothetical protein